MTYLRSTISSWDPATVAAEAKMLDEVAERLTAKTQKLDMRVANLPDTGSWSGAAQKSAAETMRSNALEAATKADQIRAVRSSVVDGLTNIDSARLRLLRLAELAESEGIVVDDDWALTPLDPAAQDAAFKLAEWTTSITVGLASLAEADATLATTIRGAASELRGVNSGMQGFFPIALAGLAVAVELATAALIAAGVITGAALIALLLEKFAGIATPQDILDKIPDVFRSEDGPGQYEPRNHNMSERAAEYQEQVTGSPRGIEYVVEGVAFDGFKDGVLIDAKGLGYEGHIDENGNWKPYFTGDKAMVDQAERQLSAAGDTPIEWRVADERAANAIRSTLREAGIRGIEIVHVAPN
ncbi:Tox-REase-5 domain-containing protein [Rhodococcus sp. IEGM 1330]|uniref:Tox-REase-5 domain-containing protein n=1 Tax=Rhodococcus sp. IEGM 1330 TaxID=3082225 RepID=UPI002954C631|nr:Tox-REase-5 domain-containing protein [Rhodococcus sp. IEGM 1330]MDV8022205.1 Tox-REase-5 domain-containing protein [Rhodococcus sp. IEGM 1330]